MPPVDWNRFEWGQRYSWPDSGEEWSRAWGGSEAQWFGAIYPRLHRHLPAHGILEIAPGYGRWTKFLIPACSSYLGIDLSANCIDACRKRFKDATHAAFFENDGLSLSRALDGSFDFVFSFDSLVHVEIDVLESYIPQLVKKLTPNGVGFLHHSNLQDGNIPRGQPVHGRAASVSGRSVANLLAQNGAQVVVQELINWVNCTGLLDCFTLFCRSDGAIKAEPIHLINPGFMMEAQMIAQFQRPYCSETDLWTAGA